MSELDNILSQGHQPTDEALKRYLAGNASKEEQYLIEQLMNELPFVNDAVEGLQQFKNKQQMQDIINSINKDLHLKTRRKKSQFFKQQREAQNGIMVYALLIILLCVLGYFVIHLLLKEPKNKNKVEFQKTETSK